MSRQHADTDPERRLGLRFPDGFVWGAATSAYQIEGAANEDGRGASVWDTFSRDARPHPQRRHRRRGRRPLPPLPRRPRPDARPRPAQRTASRSPGRGCMPDGTGPVNQRGLDFYRRLVDGLHERGITPMVTLFHWDLPQALQDEGGWESRDIAYRFADYADGGRPTRSATPCRSGSPSTSPRPWCRTATCTGTTPPATATRTPRTWSPTTCCSPTASRCRRCGRTGSAARIGPALNLHPCYPADDSAGARAAAARCYDGYENRLYLDPILQGGYPADVLADLGPVQPDGPAASTTATWRSFGSPVDLLAVQYYTPVSTSPRDGEHGSRSGRRREAFWQQIYPKGMYDILTRVKPRLRRHPADHHRERPARPGHAGRRRHRRRRRPGRASCATTSPPRTGPSPTG